jgi:hypothetical protein
MEEINLSAKGDRSSDNAAGSVLYRRCYLKILTPEGNYAGITRSLFRPYRQSTKRRKPAAGFIAGIPRPGRRDFLQCGSTQSTNILDAMK